MIVWVGTYINLYTPSDIYGLTYDLMVEKAHPNAFEIVNFKKEQASIRSISLAIGHPQELNDGRTQP